MTTVDYWIKKLELEPHPEGGFYRETYRSDEHIPLSALPKRYQSQRHFATSIYFLLTSDNASNFHCLQSDELWYFHYGSSLTIHTLSDEHGYKTVTLGQDADQQHFSSLIRAGTWFGATVDKPGAFTLISCVVTPGFDFSDFVLGDRKQLLRAFPAYEAIINKLTEQ